MNKSITEQEANDLVKQKILDNEVFAISRVGCGFETIVVRKIALGLPISNFEIQRLCIQGGVYGDSIDDFYNEYVKGLKVADLQVVWVGSDVDNIQNDLFNKFSKESIKTGFKVVEPYYFDNPWSSSLKDKKVLIINPLRQTITYQYKKYRDKIWQNFDVLPKFDLIMYESVQSLGGVGPHSSWSESLKIMKDEISELEFDIALLGCGTYGLPLVNHIRSNMNKSAIYVGGALQIFFGIKGKRWDGEPKINKFYNEYWRRPFDVEVPQYAKMVEGGCYW